MGGGGGLSSLFNSVHIPKLTRIFVVGLEKTLCDQFQAERSLNCVREMDTIANMINTFFAQFEDPHALSRIIIWTSGKVIRSKTSLSTRLTPQVVAMPALRAPTKEYYIHTV